MKYFLRLFSAFLLKFSLSISSEQTYVVGDLMGQFGNQMFIIAATTSLAIDNGAIPTFPSLLFDDRFDISINYAHVFYHLNTTQPKRNVNHVFLEEQFTYSPIHYQPNMMIRGWFQSEKYFLKHKETIIALFSPHEEIVNYLTNKYPHLIQNPDIVAIHYRSYDVEDPEHKVYAICGTNYYEKAIQQFPENSLFVVFSNNMEQCKNLLSSIPRLFYFVEGEAHYYDFYLMSMCQHQIICNSSFSWWAAYLNRNPNKQVIAPANWFNLSTYWRDQSDLIPPEWIVLDDK